MGDAGFSRHRMRVEVGIDEVWTRQGPFPGGLTGETGKGLEEVRGNYTSACPDFL